MQRHTSSQEAVYKEVRDSLAACQPNRAGEQISYSRRIDPNTARSRDDQEGSLGHSSHRYFQDSREVPEVVKRLEAKAAERQDKLDQRRREEERLALSEVKPKPRISEYDYKRLDRVPLHMRDYNSFAEKRKDQLRERVLSKERADSKECTFNPTINKKKTEHLRAKTPNELIAWKQDKEMSIALMRMENADLVGSECTFKPEINPKSRRLMTGHEGINVPLKRTKQKYIEEYLKKEKEDLFQPKINVTSKQIIKNGYQRPPEIEVKQLKRKGPMDRSKSQSQINGTRSARPSHRDYSKNNDYNPTAEEIIERYRKEAKPKRRDPKKRLSMLRGRARSVESSRERLSATPTKKAKDPKNLGNARSPSKEELREVLKQANDKLQNQRKAALDKSRLLKKAEFSVQTTSLDDTQTASIDGTHSHSCYRLDRKPSKSRNFDNGYWFEHVKEKNEDHLKKQVEKLIYRDADRKSPMQSARKASQLHSPLKQKH